MMKIFQRINKERVPYYLCALFFIFSFVIFASIWCLKDGKTLLDLYLPNTGYIDEVTYYKQIEPMALLGTPPSGYFGYDELHALRSTFFAWSFVLLLPYAFMGRIFGWNILSPMLCNLFFLTAALALFVFWARPRIWQMLFFIAALAMSPILVRYAMSGMVEPIFYSCMIAMLAAHYRLQRQFSPAVLAFAYLLSSFFVLARPYMLLLLLIPLYHWQKKNRPLAIACTAALSLLLAFLYLMIARYYTSGAPINTSVLGYFDGGLLGGIQTILSKLIAGYKEFVYIALSGFSKAYSGTVLLQCILSYLLCAILLIRSPRTVELWLALFYGLAMSAALILLFNPNIGFRHLSSFYLFNILIFSMQVTKAPRTLCAAYLLPMFGLMLLIPSIYRIDDYFTLPYRTEESVARHEKWTSELEEVLVLDDSCGYENTISWWMNGYFDIQMCIPAGFGIEYDNTSMPPDTEIKSRYALALQGSDFAARFENNSDVLWEDETYILFRRRD